MQKEAATFAALLTAENESNSTRRTGTSIGGLAPLATGVGNDVAGPGRGTTAKVCATQPCPLDKPVDKPVATVGKASATVRAVGDSQLDVAGVQTKIERAYLAGVRRCAITNNKGSLVASKTTLAFTVGETGRVLELTSSGADQAVADCIGKLAKSWRFTPATSDDGAANRLEATVETNP